MTLFSRDATVTLFSRADARTRMHWSSLLARLSVAVVALAALGSLYTVAVAALGSPPVVVVAALTALVVAAAAVYGVRAAGVTATSYW